MDSLHPWSKSSIHDPNPPSLIQILNPWSKSFILGPNPSSLIQILHPWSKSFLLDPNPSSLIQILQPWSKSFIIDPNPWSLILDPSYSICPPSSQEFLQERGDFPGHVRGRVEGDEQEADERGVRHVGRLPPPAPHRCHQLVTITLKRVHSERIYCLVAVLGICLTRKFILMELNPMSKGGGSYQSPRNMPLRRVHSDGINLPGKRSGSYQSPGNMPSLTSSAYSQDYFLSNIFSDVVQLIG